LPCEASGFSVAIAEKLLLSWAAEIWGTLPAPPPDPPEDPDVPPELPQAASAKAHPAAAVQAIVLVMGFKKDHLYAVRHYQCASMLLIRARAGRLQQFITCYVTLDRAGLKIR
jgi:hypothetical protein